MVNAGVARLMHRMVNAGVARLMRRMVNIGIARLMRRMVNAGAPDDHRYSIPASAITLRAARMHSSDCGTPQ